MSEKIPEELFELNVVTDNPLYEGFALEEAPSLLGRDRLRDDISPGFGTKVHRWTQVKLADVWKPPKVDGRVAPFNDYPGINMMFPCFSQRACGALREVLEPNGELLPVLSDVGSYYFFNITTVVDALDLENSKCSFLNTASKRVASIDFFAFHNDKLRGRSIFRLHEWPIGTIVTDQFVQRVHECGLNGFDFTKIWPYEKGVNWRMVSSQQVGARTEVEGLKKHTLVLLLAIQSAKPNASEKKTIKRLEKELDAQLTVSSLDAPLFGCYEGSDSVNSEYRMFLSSPDVDKLEQKLHPWLSNLGWPGEVHAVKKYGEMYDEDALTQGIEYGTN